MFRWCSHYVQLEDYGLDDNIHNITRPPWTFFLNSSSVYLALFLWIGFFYPEPLVCVRSVSSWLLRPPSWGISWVQAGSPGTMCDAFPFSNSTQEWLLWGESRRHTSGKRAESSGRRGDDPHMTRFLIRNVMMKNNFWTEQNSDEMGQGKQWHISFGVISYRPVSFPVVGLQLRMKDRWAGPSSCPALHLWWLIHQGVCQWKDGQGRGEKGEDITSMLLKKPWKR